MSYPFPNKFSITFKPNWNYITNPLSQCLITSENEEKSNQNENKSKQSRKSITKTGVVASAAVRNTSAREWPQGEWHLHSECECLRCRKY